MMKNALIQLLLASKRNTEKNGEKIHYNAQKIEQKHGIYIGKLYYVRSCLRAGIEPMIRTVTFISYRGMFLFVGRSSDVSDRCKLSHICG